MKELVKKVIQDVVSNREAQRNTPRERGVPIKGKTWAVCQKCQ